MADEFSGFDRTGVGEGWFKISDGIATLAMVAWDSWQLMRLYLAFEPPYFFKIITLPHRRAKIRAHLARFPTNYFWGRDPYNPEHILRRQELHRIGGKSYGFLSGYGLLTDIMGKISYISFDKLYIVGRAFHDKYEWGWDKSMEVIPVGSYSVSRDKIARLHNNTERPKDIVVFTSHVAAYNHPLAKAFIRELAESFPDRTLWLQLKALFLENETAQKFIYECMKGLDNIVFTPLELNDLIDKVGYAFSDPSLITLETIQFGIPSFVIDVVEKHEYCIYREYPFLCQKSSHDAIMRIRDMEAGAWTYPFEEYTNLIESPEVLIFDRIRLDLGLPSKQLDRTDSQARAFQQRVTSKMDDAQ